MKKGFKATLGGLLIVILLLLAPRAFAAEAGGKLTADKLKVAPGETFTVTLQVNATDGINGVMTNINYDNTVLELVSAVPLANWTNFSSGTSLEIIATAKEEAYSANVYALTFKVLENAKEGSTTISTDKITIDTNLKNTEKEVAGIQLTVNVETASGNSSSSNSSSSQSSKPSDSSNNSSSSSSKASTSSSSNKGTIGKTSSSSKVASIKEDQTVATSKIAYAGVEEYSLVGIVALAIVVVISIIKYKKYTGV